MMLTSSRRILLAIFALLLSITFAQAHSRRPNPLKRIAYASDASIDIVKRNTALTRRDSQLLSSDSLRLTLRAFDQTFHLHLEPNDEIVHPSGATVNVWQWDEASQQEVLAERRAIPREEVRAYHGVVVHPAHTARRLYEDREGVSRWQSGIDEEEGVMGRAAIMVHDAEGPSPRFEGLFDWRGNQHTVQTARNYHAGRHGLDPQVHKRSVDLDHIVVHRDSDILSDLEAEQLGSRDVVNAAASVACSHDAHDFNANNHLFLTGSNDDEFSRSPLEFFARPPSIGRRSWWERDDATTTSFSSLLSPLIARNLSSDFIYDPEPISRRQDALGNGSNNSYVSSIGNTQGCPKSAMVVYVGIAGDCSFTSANGGSVSNTSSTLLTVMNSVSQTYRNTFNVSLGVVELDVRQGSCPSSSSSSGGNAPWNVACSAMSIDDRLSAFSSWRASQPSNGTGLWHLLTGCASSGSNVGEIGVAWLGTLCKTDSSSSGGDTVSGTGVTANTNRNAQVVAHEMGHNFGAIHDCMSGCSLTGSKALQSNGATCCPQSGSSCNDADAHIMSPVAAQNTMKFSPCSVGNVCSMLGGGGLDTDCVLKPGNRDTLSTQQCGNGILESSEQCDAGPTGSICCSTDCKLTSGSQCDPESSACCTSSCQFASTSTLCRAAKDSSGCDTPEYCTGSSADCPTDSYKDNGSSCTLNGTSGLQCANGVCTSRDKQCQAQTSSTSGSTFSKACSVRADQSCSLACQDEGSSSTCTVFQTNFVDGTSCGYGGHCQSGKCKSDGWQSTFRGWYANNLNIAIPVTIVVAIIVLLILWALVRCCFGGGKRGGRGGAKPVAGGGAAAFVPWSRRGARGSMAAAGPPPPPPMRTSGAGAGPYGYQNVASTDYPSYAPPPGAPPPMGAPPPVPLRASRGQHNGWVDATQWNGR